MNKQVVVFGPFIGEFGWELLFWQGWVRRLCQNEFSDFHKIAISVEGRQAFYDSVDEFIPYFRNDLPEVYSARSYIADGWEFGYPGKGISQKYYWKHSLKAISSGHIPRRISNEEKWNGPSVKPFAEKILSNFESKLPRDTTYVIPWKLNKIADMTVGFKQPSDRILFHHHSNYFKPKFEDQIFTRLKASDDEEITSYFHNSESKLSVCVFPRKRNYRRADKNWSEASYRQLIDKILNKYNAHIYLCGDPDGAFFSNQQIDGCTNLIDLPAPKRLNAQLKALENSKFAVGAMSGATLFALAAGCPTVIFGFQEQMFRYYEENILNTKMNYVAEMNPSVQDLMRVVDNFISV